MPNILLALLLASVAVPADCVVVCPPAFQPALMPWVEHREQQGHTVVVIAPQGTPAATKQAILNASEPSAIRSILLVGDSPSSAENSQNELTVPTWLLESRVVVAWGSEPELASDNPYADFDGDFRPEVAVGRLPVDSPTELSAAVARIMAYENAPSRGVDRRQVNVIAGVGGFSPLVDTVLETAAAKLITNGIPAAYNSSMTYGSWRSPYCPDPRLFHQTCLARFNEGCMYWVYMGHGNRRQLDSIRTPVGTYPILHAAETNRLRAGRMPPIAVFLACYTAAFDGEQDCLAEEMLRQPGGPVAVLGGSRVTMPYAMSLFASYLLEESFEHKRVTLGEVILNAKRRMTAPEQTEESAEANSAEQLTTRTLLDAVAKAISPYPEKLGDERLEHAQLFNLLGDPLLRLPHPAEVTVTGPAKVQAGDTMEVTIESELAGECVVEVVCRRDRLTFTPPFRATLTPSHEALSSMSQLYSRANDSRWAAQQLTTPGGPQQIQITLPEEARGHAHIRVFVAGVEQCALGSADLYILSGGNE